MIDRLEGLAFNVAIKAPCLCATTEPIVLNGAQTVDGVVLTGSGTERVLVKDQADATTNGIYLANTSNWARDVDFANPTDGAQGTIVLVFSGTLYASTVFELTTASPLIGTTALNWAVAGAAALALASAWVRANLLPALTAAAARVVLGVPANSEAILKALLTTRGDIIAASGAGAAARLPVGAVHLALISDGSDPGWGLIDLANAVTGILGRTNGGRGSSVAASVAARVATNVDLATHIPFDDTAPLVTEGVEVFSQAFTAATAANRIRVTVNGFGSTTGGSDFITTALFVDGTLVKAEGVMTTAANNPSKLSLIYELAQTAGAHTYAVRIGADSTTVRLNGTAGARRYGGFAETILLIEELPTS